MENLIAWVDGLRALFIVPERIMSGALLLGALSCALWVMIAKNAASDACNLAVILAAIVRLMMILGAILTAMSALYLLIAITGNRQGLNWIVRIGLLTLPITLAIFNVLVAWQYRNGNSFSSQWDGHIDQYLGSGVGASVHGGPDSGTTTRSARNGAGAPRA